MAGGSVGTIFAELDLDATRYTKAQQKLLQDATSTTTNIEANFKNLGVKSSAEMDLMRAKITNSFDMIANSSKATANDIMRAEEAKNAKITALNEQQYGKQKTIIENLQKHWIAYAAVVASAAAAWQMAKTGAGFTEQQGILDNLAVKYKMTADTIVSEMDRASDYQIAKSELMSIALGGIAKGLKPEQLINLADAALILGDAVGKDATTALRELTESLETGRTKGLKTYLGTTLDLDSAFGDLTSKLTATEKAQAMYNMIMITSIDLQGQQTKAVDESADKIDRIEKKFSDAKLSLSLFLKEMAVGFIDNLSPLDKITKGIEGFGNAIIATLSGKHVSQLTAETMAATNAFAEEDQALKSIFSSYAMNNEALKEAVKQREEKLKADKESATATKKLLEDEAVDWGKYADAVLESQFKEYSEIAKLQIKKNEDEKKMLDQADADWVKYADAVIEENDKLYGDLAKLQIERNKKEQDFLDKAPEEWGKYADAILDELERTQQGLVKVHEDEKKRIIERGEAYRNIYKDMKGYEGDFYAASLIALDGQVAKYKELGISQQVIDAWRKEEGTKAWIAYAKSSDDFFAGAKAGFLELERSTTAWGTVGADMVKTFSVEASKQLSNLKFDFGAIMDSMLRILRDKIAEMIVQWAMYQAAAAAGLATGMGTGFVNPLSAAGAVGNAAGGAMGIAGMGAALASGASTVAGWLGIGGTGTIGAGTAMAAGSMSTGGAGTAMAAGQMGGMAAAGLTMGPAAAGYILGNVIGPAIWSGSGSFQGTAADDLYRRILSASMAGGAQMPGIYDDFSPSVDALKNLIDSDAAARAAVAQVYGQSAADNLQAGVDVQTYRRELRAQGIPGYERGISYVPQTGLALLHEGERVVPKEDNTGVNHFHLEVSGREIAYAVADEADRNPRLKRRLN